MTTSPAGKLSPEGSAGRRLTSHVSAAMSYLIETDEKPVIPMYAIGSGQATRMPDEYYVEHTMPIFDGRVVAESLSLDREGFVLHGADTSVKDFYDDEQVCAIYYPEVAALIKAHTGASKAVIFDHTARVQTIAMQQDKGVREVVRFAHNDYTVKSGPQRVRDLLEAGEARERLAKRFAVINVWRPIRGPVQAIPLAVCDAQSVAPDDLVATDLDYGERTGEIYQLAFNSEHRWFYFPHMHTDEALLFKCYDSAADGRARFTPHSAFDDPASPRDAPPRESIEVRALVFF